MNDERLDALLARLRPTFTAEQELLTRVPACESEADLFARQRATLLEEARATLRDWLAEQKPQQMDTR